jgi:hypothetical protein
MYPSKESFAACGGERLFTQPRENDVSLKTSFGAKRRKKSFYTTPTKNSAFFASGESIYPKSPKIKFYISTKTSILK